MITVDVIDNTVMVEAPSRLSDIISSIPGLRVQDDAWTGPATPATLIAIAKDLGQLREFAPSERATARMRTIRHEHEVVDDAKQGAAVGEYDDRLFDFQAAGVWMLRRGDCLLGDEMGTGKTVMALTAARQVWNGGEVTTVLVVAPNSMKFRWAEEAAIWFPEAHVHVVHGPKPKREKAWAEWSDAVSDLWPEPRLVVVNWESLRTLSTVAGYGSVKLTDADREPGILNDINWEIVVADEAHRAKDPKAKQTRALWSVSKHATHRWALTGTPVLNTPSDLWSIGRFYDPDSYGTSKHRWQRRYVEQVDTPWGPKDLGIRVGREKEFAAWFDLSFIRRTKDEVLDLPEITYQTRSVEMGSTQGAAYRRLRDEMIVAVENGIVAATDPLSLLTRLSQAASASLVLEDGDIVGMTKPSNKLDALKEIIAEGTGQLVVFAQSKKLINLIDAELPEDVTRVRITGDEDASARAVNVNTFQDGRAQLALCTLGAGSEGINLFAASTVVFLQRSYHYGQNIQAEARVHRNGQQHPVTVIDLVSRNTIDEDVIEALQSKGDTAEQVLRDRARQLMKEKV